MATTWYHFIERDDKTYYDVRCAESFKEAVLNLAQYHGDDSELFRKCLNGFDDNDVDGIVEFYNHFSHMPIDEIYIVKESIYPAEKHYKFTSNESTEKLTVDDFIRNENIQKLTVKDFTRTYCSNCDNKFCEGVGTWWFDRCQHKFELEGYQDEEIS